ncbi:hypothetical protein AMTRI_Chr12g274540 [Amborella trichopoda]
MVVGFFGLMFNSTVIRSLRYQLTSRISANLFSFPSDKPSITASSFYYKSFAYVISNTFSHQYAPSTTCILSKGNGASIYEYGFTEIHLSHRLYSTMAESILVQAQNPSQLALELSDAVDEKRFDDAWKAFKRYKQMEGFPRKSVLNKLIASLAESGDLQWVDKAYSLVEMAFGEGKHELLHKESLIFLSFIAARAGLPVQASTILRKMVQVEEYPPVDAWLGVIAHMSRTAPGAFLAAEIVLELGHFFKDNRVDPRKKSNSILLSMKPNTFAFNISLMGSLVYGFARKAEQLLELIPRIGVKPDASLLITIAHIYEKNGRIDEIKKLRRHINEACGLGDFQYQQFYNCYLACLLNFGDLGAATELVLEILRRAKKAQTSLATAQSVVEAIAAQKPKRLLPKEHDENRVISSVRLFEGPALSIMEFIKDQNFLRIQAEAKELLDSFSAQLQNRVELVRTQDGILYPTEKMCAKLVKAFLEVEKITDLAELLIEADMEEGPASPDSSFMVQVINTCIALGFLDQAHDLLDEMRLSGLKTGSLVYSSLLKAYCKANRPNEVGSLLRDAQKCGVQLDASCYEALIQSRVLQRDAKGANKLYKVMKKANISPSTHHGFESLVKGCEGNGEPKLMAKLLEEIKSEQGADCGVIDWNHVIHFFCKKGLMPDAQKAFKKMVALGHKPNAQTFHSLVTGYSAIGGKYHEITELWGVMKVISSSSPLKFDQGLLDSLLYNFVRGGFFQRANEVINLMEREGMFIDKYKYRQLCLKYHKTLYKNKKGSKFQTEAQYKRREEALTFKNWVGLD